MFLIQDYNRAESRRAETMLVVEAQKYSEDLRTIL